MMFTEIRSYHMNPHACGVAKFNLRLARELGVPCYSVHQPQGPAPYPLYSLKISETMLSPRWAPSLPEPYDLLLHDVCRDDRNTREWHWVRRARRAYAVNEAIAASMRTIRDDVTLLWCPSLVETPAPRAPRTVLTFGMARTFQPARGTSLAASVAGDFLWTQADHFRCLHDLLVDTGDPFTILLSTGVHEGTPWDQGLQQSIGSLQEIFGADRVESLGYLSDAALDREIRAAEACALFYTPAWRANNTSAWAVLERGTPLITNLDALSPDVPCYDIAALDRWPAVWDHSASPVGYGWEDLCAHLR